MVNKNLVGGVAFHFAYDKSILSTHLRYMGQPKTVKTDTLNLRISPAIKSTLRFIADREKRSMSNMIDYLVTDYCSKNGVVLPAAKKGLKNANKRSTSNDSPSTQNAGRKRKGTNGT